MQVLFMWLTFLLIFKLLEFTALFNITLWGGIAIVGLFVVYFLIAFTILFINEMKKRKGGR